ncbi:MAG: hypothetical protein OEW15_15035 [Nitrospirota bacterium]|nr:hypothetical protein [Nitrospirota bacterium]
MIQKSHSRHIIYPLLTSALFFAIALSPVDLLGCKTRGLLAFVIAFGSGIGALYSVIKALKGRVKGDKDASWWIVSTLLLTIPVVALLILA